MSDGVFSETPPTEPGWYWVRQYGSVCIAQLGEKWSCGIELDYVTAGVLVALGFEFGPRIPTAEELAALSQDKIRLDWLFRTVLQAWPREKIDAQMKREKEMAQEPFSFNNDSTASD